MGSYRPRSKDLPGSMPRLLAVFDLFSLYITDFHRISKPDDPNFAFSSCSILNERLLRASRLLRGQLCRSFLYKCKVGSSSYWIDFSWLWIIHDTSKITLPSPWPSRMWDQECRRWRQAELTTGEPPPAWINSPSDHPTVRNSNPKTSNARKWSTGKASACGFWK